MLTNVFFYYTTSERTLLQWCMVSADPPGIMFVGFFCEKCLLTIAKYIMVIPARLHCMQGIPDEKLKIGALGTNVPCQNSSSNVGILQKINLSSMIDVLELLI